MKQLITAATKRLAQAAAAAEDRKYVAPIDTMELGSTNTFLKLLKDNHVRVGGRISDYWPERQGTMMLRGTYGNRRVAFVEYRVSVQGFDAIGIIVWRDGKNPDMLRADESGNMETYLPQHTQWAHAVKADLLNDTSVDRKAEEFMKFIQSALKARGFVRSASRQSALYHWEFKRDNRVISISGWHGTGKWGTGKTVFTLADTEPNPGTKVDRHGQVFDTRDDATPAEHNENVDLATRYIKAVK